MNEGPQLQRTLQRAARRTPDGLSEGFVAGVFHAIDQAKRAEAAWVRFLLRWLPVVLLLGIAAMITVGLRGVRSPEPPAMPLYQSPGTPDQLFQLP